MLILSILALALALLVLPVLAHKPRRRSPCKFAAVLAVICVGVAGPAFACDYGQQALIGGQPQAPCPQCAAQAAQQLAYEQALQQQSLRQQAYRQAALREALRQQALRQQALHLPPQRLLGAGVGVGAGVNVNVNRGLLGLRSNVNVQVR